MLRPRIITMVIGLARLNEKSLMCLLEKSSFELF